MDFLHTEGQNIVDSRGSCAGGWMNMEDFITSHSGAELSSFARQRCLVNAPLEGLVRKHAATAPQPA